MAVIDTALFIPAFASKMGALSSTTFGSLKGPTNIHERQSVAVACWIWQSCRHTDIDALALCISV
jgi:hypothetical protein